MTATDPTSSPLPVFQYGVQWTPSHGQQKVATSPTTFEHANRLTRQLRVAQRILGHVDDAVVVYRFPGGDWSTTPPAAPATRVAPPAFPPADDLAEQLLDEIRQNPEEAMKTLRRYFPNAT